MKLSQINPLWFLIPAAFLAVIVTAGRFDVMKRERDRSNTLAGMMSEQRAAYCKLVAHDLDQLMKNLDDPVVGSPDRVVGAAGFVVDGVRYCTGRDVPDLGIDVVTGSKLDLQRQLIRMQAQLEVRP